MASRMVTNESAKCRSGREAVRISNILASGRGGKSAGSLRDNESVAADDHRYVMVPALVRAPLEVVEA